MKEYRYPFRALAGDYLRSLTGALVGFGVLLSVPPSPAIILIFGSVAGLCSFFGYRTIKRHLTRVAVSDAGICDAGIGTRIISWEELQVLKLRYYGTKRQERGHGGFMQLTLRGVTNSLTYESSMEGFNFIVWRAAKALRANGNPVDPTSAGNLLALGVDADSDTPPPED